MKLSSLHNPITTVDNIRVLTENKGPLDLAIRDLIKTNVEWALVGGLAVGFHAPPRGTVDIDILVRTEQDVQKISGTPGFKKIRPHALEHKQTGVEVKVLTVEFLKIDANIVAKAIQTATVKNGIPVVTREALVALKLQRCSHYDKGDIENIIRTGGPIDLTGWSITQKQKELYDTIEQNLATQ